MRQFLCEHCLSPVPIAENLAEQTTVCPNCNTRQPVPANTTPWVPSPENDPSAARTSGLPQMPGYDLVLMTGYLLIGGGVLLILSGVAYGVTGIGGPESGRVLVGGAAALNGLVTMGFGQLLHCVRDIARNSWQRRTSEAARVG